MNPLRQILEDEMCVHLFRFPKDVLRLDVALLRGRALRFAELLQLAPTLACCAGAHNVVATASRFATERSRREQLEFAKWLKREAGRRSTTRPFEHIVAALQELAQLEESAQPKLPAWQRHLRRAGAA